MADVSRVNPTAPTPPVRRIDRESGEERERRRRPVPEGADGDSERERRDSDGHEVDTYA